MERKESVYPKGYSEFQIVPYKFSPFGGVCVWIGVRAPARFNRSIDKVKGT